MSFTEPLFVFGSVSPTQEIILKADSKDFKVIQDSKEDWLQQAALMHKAHSHSYCTTTAAAFIYSSQSLFRERSSQFLYPCEFEIPWFTSAKNYQLVDLTFWDSQVQNQPLHRRGWVVQERLLAPRVLHFSLQQLVWECRKFSAAEKYPEAFHWH